MLKIALVKLKLEPILSLAHKISSSSYYPLNALRKKMQKLQNVSAERR